MLFGDVVNEETGAVLAEADTELTENLLNELLEAGIRRIKLLKSPRRDFGMIRNTLLKDPTENREEALRKSI